MKDYELRKRSRLRKLENLDAIVPTDREKLFFKFYQELNNSQAAYVKLREHEGTGKPGMAENKGYLRSVVTRFMNKPGIAKLQADFNKQLAKVTEKQLAKYALSKERVIEELVKIAFHKQTDLMSWGPDGVATKTSDELDEDAKAVINEVVEVETKDGLRRVKLKTIDKVKALELLGKQLGLFKETVEHEHKHVSFIIEK